MRPLKGTLSSPGWELRVSVAIRRPGRRRWIAIRVVAAWSRRKENAVPRLWAEAVAPFSRVEAAPTVKTELVSRSAESVGFVGAGAAAMAWVALVCSALPAKLEPGTRQRESPSAEAVSEAAVAPAMSEPPRVHW